MTTIVEQMLHSSFRRQQPDPTQAALAAGGQFIAGVSMTAMGSVLALQSGQPIGHVIIDTYAPLAFPR